MSADVVIQSQDINLPGVPTHISSCDDRITKIHQQQTQEETNSMDQIRRRSGVLNVWTPPAINQLHLIEDDDHDSQYSSRKPSGVSSLEDQLEVINSQEDKSSCHDNNDDEHRNDDKISEFGERKHQEEAYIAAVSLLDGIMEDNRRKTSDPMIAKRCTETRKNALKKQRCFSDSTGRSPLINSTHQQHMPLDDSLSYVGGDSGIVDCVVTKTAVKKENPCKEHSLSTANLSATQTRNGMTRTGSLDEGALSFFNRDESLNHPEKSRLKNGRGRLTKHLSLSSVGGSSDTVSISSLLGSISTHSMATELLSNLGFGDFDSPGLIPDRFIPAKAHNAKPSVMQEYTLLGLYSSNYLTTEEPKVACSVSTNEADPKREFETTNTVVIDDDAPRATSSDSDLLPLGATADNFITTKGHRFSPPPSPSPPPLQTTPSIPHNYAPPAPPPQIDPYYYNRKYVQLETVPEETASDLSPSPRWLSPRVSLDHSYYDLSTGQLGSGLNLASRKRSLPNREGYRMSMESLLSEQDSTVYFSITSYDDDLAREQELLEVVPKTVLPPDEGFPGRSRRKGVHDAPPGLLSWLRDQRMSVDDEDEMPWPFNEQAHIRRSLTEYTHQQRLSRSSSSTVEERSVSPDDPLEGVFQRRFSVNGPLTLPSNLLQEPRRRLSLPSNSSYGHYRLRGNSPGPPPSRGTNLEPTIDEEEIAQLSEDLANLSDSEEKEDTLTNNSTSTSLNVEYQNSTKLPPGMTKSDALEYKRESLVLKAELSETQQKLKDAERLRRLEGEGQQRRALDTEEWLRSELWMKETKCRELEEVLEGVQRDYKLLQQNQAITVARIKEEARDAKEKEISMLKQKIEQKERETREKVAKLEEEIRHFRTREGHLLKKANQQNLKSENEELNKELIRAKEQLRQEKLLSTATSKDKATEIKQIRSKLQLEKEEALKNQKEFLTKMHATELASLRQLLHQSGEREAKGRSTLHVTRGSSPIKLETKRLTYQLERMEGELKTKEEEISQLRQQLKLLHKEHVILQKGLTKEHK